MAIWLVPLSNLVSRAILPLVSAEKSPGSEDVSFLFDFGAIFGENEVRRSEDDELVMTDHTMINCSFSS